MARAHSLHFRTAAAVFSSLFGLAAAPTAATASKPSSAHAAASCANTTLTPRSSDLEQIREAVLCLVNREREAHGESALLVNAKLTHAAQAHSDDMANQDYFSHVAPDGSSPLDRMRASGYIYSSQLGYEVGENIAWGTLWLASPESIVSSWMASPEHRANILDAGYRETGVGVSSHAPASMSEGQAGGLYTQDFGTIFSSGHASRHPSARHRQSSGDQPRTLSSENPVRSGSPARKHRHRRHHPRHRRREHRRRHATARRGAERRAFQRSRHLYAAAHNTGGRSGRAHSRRHHRRRHRRRRTHR